MTPVTQFRVAAKGLWNFRARLRAAWPGEIAMFTWLIGALLALSAVVAEWFISLYPRFGVVQGIINLVVFDAVVVILARFGLRWSDLPAPRRRSSQLGCWVTIRCPRDLAPVMRRAGGCGARDRGNG
jgi:hypothetical protein